MLRTSGQAYEDFVELIIRAALDPAVGMADAFEGAAELLTGSGYIDPCPIGTVAREVASTHEPLREVASAVIQNWIDRLVAIFAEAGMADAKAQSLATLCVSSIEGGFILARTKQDVSDWLAIGEQLTELIQRELP